MHEAVGFQLRVHICEDNASSVAGFYELSFLHVIFITLSNCRRGDCTDLERE